MATNVVLIGEQKPDIELHVQETIVEHPSVPMRWCFSRTMHEHIVRAVNDGTGYGLLIVARLMTDIEGVYEVRAIKDPFSMFTFLTLPRPGAWMVGAFLFERSAFRRENLSSRLQQQMTSVFLRRHRLYEDRFAGEISNPVDVTQRDLEKIFEGASAYLIARHAIQIEVPKEIFAKEPSPARLAFANYFTRKKPRDECALRRRLILMSIFGIFPYVIWEFLKRFEVLLVGVVSALFLFKGSLKTIGYALCPRVRSHFGGKVAVDPMTDTPIMAFPFFRGSKFLLTPGMLILIATAGNSLYGAAPTVYAWLITAVAFIEKWTPVIYEYLLEDSVRIISVAGLSGLFVLYVFARIVRRSQKRRARARRHQQPREPSAFSQWLERQWDGLHDRLDKREQANRLRANERRLEENRMRAERIASQAPLLVCGEAPQVVALEALPKEMQTFRLQFVAFKRKVCRPFG